MCIRDRSCSVHSLGECAVNQRPLEHRELQAATRNIVMTVARTLISIHILANIFCDVEKFFCIAHNLGQIELAGLGLTDDPAPRPTTMIDVQPATTRHMPVKRPP